MAKLIQKASPTQTEFERFQDLTKKLLSVPPKQLREAKAEYITKRKTRKARAARKSSARPQSKKS